MNVWRVDNATDRDKTAIVVTGRALATEITYFAWNACSYSERIVLPPLVRQSFTRSSSALTGCLPNRISSKRSVIVVFSVMPFEASVGEYRPTIGFGTVTAKCSFWA